MTRSPPNNPPEVLCSFCSSGSSPLVWLALSSFESIDWPFGTFSMLLRAGTRGVAARATLAALRQQQHHVSYQQLQVHSRLPVICTSGQQQVSRWFGSAAAKSSQPNERDEKHIEADKVKG